MSLDDAVNAAKVWQNQQAQMDRARLEREEQEEAEIQALVQEAAQGLSSQARRSEQFVKVSQVLLFGGYSSQGRRYKVVRRERCWVLSSGGACRTSSSELVPSSVLLLESGQMGRVYQDQGFDPEIAGEFVTASPLARLSPHDLFWGGPRATHVDELKRALGSAIVTYGAA